MHGAFAQLQDSLLNDPLTGRAPSRSRAVTLAIAAVAALGASFADTEPTGIAGWDLVLTTAVAFLTVLAVSVSPRRVAIVVATVAGAFVGLSLWLIPATLGFVAALAPVALTKRDRAVGAIAAALAVQALLRLPPIGFFGLPSMIAGAAMIYAWISGYRTASKSTRKLVRRGVATVATFVVVAGLLGGTVLLGARDDVDRGIRSARLGLAAVRAGDTDAVVEELGFAADAFDKADDSLGGVALHPLRLVPIVAQHYRVVATASAEAAGVSRQAARASQEADISSITMTAGSVDLSALSDMLPELEKTVDLLRESLAEIESSRTHWLVAPVESRIDSLTDEIREVLPSAELAVEAARVVPGMLGEGVPRRYLVAFGTPAESREFGGLFGSYALLEFDKGTVRRIDLGRTVGLYDLARSGVQIGSVEGEFPPSFLNARPQMWPQNLTGSPNIGVVAEATRQVLDGIGGGSIDGLIYLDAYALTALLEITGPVEVDGVPGPLSPATAPDFFFDGQYRLPLDRDETFELLANVFESVMDRLLQRELPGPERLGAILGPASRQGRLQIATFDDAENAFLRSVKLQRTFEWPADASDGFAVVQTNGSATKLDLYLSRDVTYDVSVDDDGVLRATMVVDLASRVPAGAPIYVLGRQDPGVNKVLLSIYTPHIVASAQLDGQPVEPAAISEFGYRRYTVAVDLLPNSDRSISFELVGQVDPRQPYDLAVWHQPLVNNDEVSVRFSGPQGSHEADFTLIEDLVVFEDSSENPE